MGTGATIRAALIVLVIATVQAVSMPASAQQAPEHRALWAFAWGPGFKNTDEVSELVNRAKLANCNVIAPQVRKTGDAYYFPTRPNRDIRASDIADDYDPLMDLCDQAHAQGLQVYAWVVAKRIASDTPTNPDHMMNRHPDWLTKTISGGTLFTGEGYYADPGHPRAAEWNYNVAMDLILHYPIDGLVFDYIRYPLQNSGYNDTALARFQARYSPNPPIPYYTDGLWSAWRREQVTHFIRKVYASALAVKPQIVIGAATDPDRLGAAYTAKFQDWRSWMIGGTLDCNYPMIYTTSNTTFITRVGDCVANGGSRHTYVLQGSYMNTISNSMTQMGLARTNGAKGIGVYRYGFTYAGDPNTSVDDEPGFYSALTSQVFTQPVGLPSMPWKTSTTVGHIKGRIIDTLQGAGVDTAWISVVPAGGGSGYGTYGDGTGFYAYMNLAPGNYNITATKGSFTQTKPVTIVGGTIQTLDFLASGVDAASIAAAKQLANGAGVALPQMTVTAGNNQLRNKFYIEDPDRAAGILVELPTDSDVVVQPGDIVKVYGTLGTAANGERRIANPLVYTIETDTEAIRPIEIRGKDLAGASPNIATSGVDVSKVGLLIESLGKVTAVDESAKYFYVDDGGNVRDGTGNAGLRVVYSDLADGNSLTAPQINSYVRVRGISSMQNIAGGFHSTLIPREQNDISVDSGVVLHAPGNALLAGWTLLTIPGTPLDPSPSSSFGAVPIDGRLYQWDARTQGLVIYDSWSPERFGGIMRGDGYWLQTDAAYPMDLTVYSTSVADFLVGMPKAGWTLLGNPYNTEKLWGDTLVANGLEVQPMLVAAKSRNWLNSEGYWWDNSTQGLCDMGLPEDFVISNSLLPWHGYWIQSYVDDLSLIFR
jgi:uncharacterized lipoprotein YddW (UPF0748 family)